MNKGIVKIKRKTTRICWIGCNFRDDNDKLE